MTANNVENIAQPREREKVFLQLYDWLLKSAYGLTRGSKEEAEDLVQDLYVRFVQSKAILDLSDPKELRGYLYKALRNTSNSKARREGKDALTSLSIIDFDSVEFAVSAVDRSGLLLVRSDLATICEYACIRRSTSTAAGVLSLRFFLGYFPSEIVQLLRSTPNAVAKLTETARLEAKAYLSRPDSLHFMGRSTSATSVPLKPLPDEPDKLFMALRKRLFANPEGDCISAEDLREKYEQQEKQPISKNDFAHLVSCWHCLDIANKLLGLESLSERFSVNSGTPWNNNRPSPPSMPNQKSIKSLRRKLRETYEHRPNKLEVAVNGEVRGGQRITSANSEFQIQLDPQSSLNYVELLSEQGLVLLYLDLDIRDIEDPSSQHEEVELSDQRCLTVDVVQRAGVPVIEVYYYDPVLEAESESYPTELSELLAGPPPVRKPEGFAITRAVSRTRKAFSSSYHFPDWHWPLSIILVVGLTLLFVGIGSLRPWKTKTVQALNASTLLTQSIHVAHAVPAHDAVRRTFSLDIRTDKGDLISSTRIETLRSQMPRRSAVRMFDAHHKIIAGRWAESSGKATSYTVERGLDRSTKVPDPQPSFQTAWVHTPEADDFSEIASDQKNLILHRRAKEYEISYDNVAPAADSGIVSADLTLEQGDLRPISETLRIRNHNTIRQYQFRELTYEVLPGNRVQDSDFSPDAQLISLHPGRVGIPNDVSRDAHLALEALQVLSNLGPEMEQLVDLDRLPDGTVQISGVLPSSAQKTSLEQVFRSLSNEGQLRLVLHSSDESLAAQPHRSETTVESPTAITVDDQNIPLDSQIRAALSEEHIPETEMNARVTAYATHLLHDAATMHREAWIIYQISAKDFTHEDLQLMPPPDRILWLTLLDQHIRALEQELALVDGDLKPLMQTERVHSPPAAPSSQPTALTSVSDLEQVAQALNNDGVRLDHQLTAGLTLSSVSPLDNQTVADIAQLLGDLRIREGTLRETVEHLQSLGRSTRPQ